MGGEIFMKFHTCQGAIPATVHDPIPACIHATLNGSDTGSNSGEGYGREMGEAAREIFLDFPKIYQAFSHTLLIVFLPPNGFQIF